MNAENVAMSGRNKDHPWRRKDGEYPVECDLVDWIAELTGMDRSLIQNTLFGKTPLTRKVVSLESHVRDVSDGDPCEEMEAIATGREWVYLKDTISDTRSDALGTEADHIQLLLRMTLQKLLRTLPYRQREVVTLRYGLDKRGSHTLKEVGDIFRTCGQNIRVIEAKGLRALMQPSRAEELERFLLHDHAEPKNDPASQTELCLPDYPYALAQHALERDASFEYKQYAFLDKEMYGQADLYKWTPPTRKHNKPSARKKQ